MNRHGTDLSVIIPAFNEESRIQNAVIRTSRFLRNSGMKWELIVVDDGSTDSTPNILERLAAGLPQLRIMRVKENRGKGDAVRQGLAHAGGKTVIFADCDLSTPPREIANAVSWIKRGFDIAIGSRAAPGARIPVPSPLRRRISSRIFHLLVRILFGLEFADTQCGFKAFSRRAARIMAKEGKVAGFAFDVELLLLARRHKMKVKEFPVVWRDKSDSKISILRHAPAMLGSLISMRSNFREVISFHPARMMPLILLSVLCAITAQILFKHGAIALPKGAGFGAFIAAIAGSSWVWLGIASYAISAVAWLTVLARVDLSFAFPMLSLGFVFAAIYSRVFLLESLAWNRLVGIALVIAGVIFIATSGRETRKENPS